MSNGGQTVAMLLPVLAWCSLSLLAHLRLRTDLALLTWCAVLHNVGGLPPTGREEWYSEFQSRAALHMWEHTSRLSVLLEPLRERLWEFARPDDPLDLMVVTSTGFHSRALPGTQLWSVGHYCGACAEGALRHRIPTPETRPTAWAPTLRDRYMEALRNKSVPGPWAARFSGRASDTGPPSGAAPRLDHLVTCLAIAPAAPPVCADLALAA